MKQQTSLFEIIVASVAITGTLFLLHRLTRPKNNWYNQAQESGFNIAINQPATIPVPVKIVEEEDCPFPNEMLVEFDNGYNQHDWGELNPGAPDIPGNRF